MKLLLAVDGSACSEAAAREVARRPWPAGTEVKLLSVIEPPFTPTTETWVLPDSYYTQMEKAGREQAHAAIGTALKHLRAGSNSPLEVLTAVVEGYPKDTILDEAQKWGADLIILGSHGYRGWQRFLLGSVSQAVATHADCSVEIVRCSTPAESHPEEKK